MIQVNMRYYNVIRDATGRDRETLSVARGTTLRSLLRDYIAHQHPKVRKLLFLQTGDISPYTRFFHGSKVVGEQDWDSPLQDGDEVMVFPAVAGG
jgi:MoaD family protein